MFKISILVAIVATITSFNAYSAGISLHAASVTKNHNKSTTFNRPYIYDAGIERSAYIGLINYESVGLDQKDFEQLKADKMQVLNSACKLFGFKKALDGLMKETYISAPLDQAVPLATLTKDGSYLGQLHIKGSYSNYRESMYTINSMICK